MFQKLTNLFSGEPQASKAQQNPRPIPSAESKKPGHSNMSLLQFCDQKLEKWSKFFALEDDLPSPETETAVQNDTEATEEKPPATEAPSPDRPAESLSQSPNEVGKFNILSSYLASYYASDSTTSAAAVQAEVTPEESPTVHLASPSEPSEIVQTAVSNSSTTAQPPPEPSYATPVAPQPHNDEQIESQFQQLEHYIDRIAQTENTVTVFQEEMRQSLAAIEQNNEKLLRENKDNLEIMLKSAFKKLVDRQNTWESSNNQNIDLLQQIIEANRKSIEETVGKMHKVSSQIEQLNDNLRRLSESFEEYKQQAGAEKLKARLAALEEKQQQHKSWFGKK